MGSVISRTRRLEQRSTRIVFFIAGFGMAAWAPLVPFAKARAGIGDGALGLLLLCLGVGSIVTMSLAGALAARFGCRRVVIASAVPLCLSPAPVGDRLQPGAARRRAARLRCQSRLDRRDHEHPGDHRRTGERTVDDVGIPRPVQPRRHRRCRLHRRARSAPEHRRSPRPCAWLAASLSRWRRQASHLLPHGSETRGSGVRRCRTALCCSSALSASLRSWRKAPCSTGAPSSSLRFDGMATAYAGLGYAVFSLTMTIGRLTGRPYRAAVRRHEHHRLRWHLRRGRFRTRDAGAILATDAARLSR